jgi:ATP-binding cassette subfamily F protein 3
VRVRQEQARTPAARPDTAAAAPLRARRSSKPARSKNSLQAERDLEREIAEAEGALGAVEEELADPAAWADPDSAARSTRRHDKARERVEQLYARLERVAG